MGSNLYSQMRQTDQNFMMNTQANYPQATPESPKPEYQYKTPKKNRNGLAESPINRARFEHISTKKQDRPAPVDQTAARLWQMEEISRQHHLSPRSAALV